MARKRYAKHILKRLANVSGKRARIVVDHILQHGFVTTEDLEKTYGYRHAPRAARDVVEQGIQLDTFSVKDSRGKRITAYQFGDLSKPPGGKAGGRKSFSKAFKNSLMEKDGGRCCVCGERYKGRYLQIDHCVPYEIEGDSHSGEEPSLDDYQLLCSSCNRAKSWSCEHCANWLEDKDSALCNTCYWGSPESFEHVALRPERRLDLTWSGDEVEDFEALCRNAEGADQTLRAFVKRLLSGLER